MGFEWENEKRETNIEKHGIDFVQAARILTREHLLLPARTSTGTDGRRGEPVESRRSSSAGRGPSGEWVWGFGHCGFYYSRGRHPHNLSQTSIQR